MRARARVPYALHAANHGMAGPGRAVGSVCAGSVQAGLSAKRAYLTVPWTGPFGRGPEWWVESGGLAGPSRAGPSQSGPRVLEPGPSGSALSEPSRPERRPSEGSSAL